MKLSKIYGYDQDKAANGVWVDLEDGARIKVAKIGTATYTQALEKASRKYRIKIRTNTLKADEAMLISAQALADAILLDWQGFETEEGTILPYSHENALKALKEYPTFRDTVELHANDPENFQDDIEVDAKN